MSKPITRAKAIDLLYSNLTFCSVAENRIMDEFGNYIFPTDVVIKKPNRVCGSTSGCMPSSVVDNYSED